MSDSPLTSRRGFLRTAAVLVPAGALAGCEGGQQPSSSTPQQDGQPSSGAAPQVQAEYKPRFFDAREWAFLQAAVDRLIPADSEGPGAIEAGVPEFIDRQMDTPYAHGALWCMQGPFQQGAPELGYQLKLVPRDLYRLGIAAANAYCAKAYGKHFDALGASARDTVLGALEGGKVELDGVPADPLLLDVTHAQSTAPLNEPHGS
jgi:gluconate 2-dehydrogenase gamma chain